MKLIDQKKRESEKKERSYGSMNHGDIYDLILMMFDNLIWRLDCTFNTRFAVYKSNLVIQGHHWIKKSDIVNGDVHWCVFTKKKCSQILLKIILLQIKQQI